MRGGRQGMTETIELTINGNKIRTQGNKTILDVCKENGIYIPTLCHLEGLSSRGSCRMCLVRVEGAKNFLPACATEVKEGMVVITEDEELLSLKKSILELLFSERIHLCMFCEKSGDCELQKLAYRFGLDHIRYSFSWKKFELDTGRKYFLFDQNRCILCRRCVRACEEIAGHAVLTVKNRGPELMVCADLDFPFNQSTCVSCGTCLQVCPTGALADKYSAYVGREEVLERKRTVCTFCSVGCSIDVLSRDGMPVRIEGVWKEGPSEGVLCVKGRFEPFYDDRIRISTPMIRKKGELIPVGWEEVEMMILEKLREFKEAESWTGLISSKATIETAKAFKELFKEKSYLLGSSGTKVGNTSLSELDEADSIILAGVDLDKECQVVSSFVKRSANRGAEIVVIGSAGEKVDIRATRKLKKLEVKEIVNLIETLSNPVFLYGAKVPSDLLGKILMSVHSLRYIGLASGYNTRGIEKEGIASWKGEMINGAVYLLLCDDEPDSRLKDCLSEADFLIVQSSFESSITKKKADIVLPSPSWSERSGTYINTEGKKKKLAAVAGPLGLTRPDEYVLIRLKKWSE